uniref:Uncharacterized protein n=1 Tax=Lactuca sativa TaxID=4236 RepID=A0A9R1VM89_LACSA|nr:hypothetical protein LSAT_V11C500289000 [Lactuca sativa]
MVDMDNAVEGGENVDLFLIRSFWGNFSFLHVFSPSRGALGVLTGLDVLFISIYAPQRLDTKTRRSGRDGSLTFGGPYPFFPHSLFPHLKAKE